MISTSSAGHIWPLSDFT